MTPVTTKRQQSTFVWLTDLSSTLLIYISNHSMFLYLLEKYIPNKKEKNPNMMPIIIYLLSEKYPVTLNTNKQTGVYQQ